MNENSFARLGQTPFLGDITDSSAGSTNGRWQNKAVRKGLCYTQNQATLSGFSPNNNKSFKIYTFALNPNIAHGSGSIRFPPFHSLNLIIVCAVLSAMIILWSLWLKSEEFLPDSGDPAAGLGTNWSGWIIRNQTKSSRIRFKVSSLIWTYRCKVMLGNIIGNV